MQARRGDRSRNGTAREDGGKRESGVRRCAREKTSEAENRESGGIRALISVSGPPRGTKEGGGVNSRDINSVLALGGLHRRKLRAEGEYYPPFSVSPRDQRLSIPPSFPFPSPPSPLLSPSCPTVASSNATTLSARGWGGVTNQRLAIVNSTCAVKQLINKRLFTSCAHGVLARTQREHIFPPRDDECGADNAADRWTTSGSFGIKIKKIPILYSEITSYGW